MAFDVGYIEQRGAGLYDSQPVPLFSVSAFLLSNLTGFFARIDKKEPIFAGI
jgi:hypothetical protein